jgi:serine/threonine protein kinase
VFRLTPISKERQIKILDFGIAKLAEDGRNVDIRKMETFAGTAGYASPEQLLGKRVDDRADVFSLGIILYEMLTGIASFTRQSMMLTEAATLNEQAPDRLWNIPASTQRLIFRSLDKVVFAFLSLSRRTLHRAPTGARRFEGGAV